MMYIRSNPLSDYHKALITTSTTTILQSKLLLDEDLQILLNFYKQDLPVKFPTYNPSLLLKISLASLVGGLISASRFNKCILLPSAVATFVVTMVEIKQFRIIKNQKELMQNIVNNAKKINTINSSIKKYLKTRTEVRDKSKNEFYQGYNVQIHDFLQNMTESEKRFFGTIMSTMKILTNYSDPLKEDFDLFKDFKPLDDNVLQAKDLDSGLQFVTQVQDLHIWITSKLLSYISTVLLSPNKQLEPKTIKTLFDVTFESLLRFLQSHQETLKKTFSMVRHSVHIVQKIKREQYKPLISNKLQNTLLSAVDNLSIIYEKSQTILRRLEDSESSPCKDLEIALLDLRNHTYAAYESVDLLCRLYGILTSQKIPAEKPTILPAESNTAVSRLPIINYNDDVDVMEENYELYLDNDCEDSVEDSKSHRDESSAYLGLMLAELQQSLKQHERFIEAKKRRGSIDLKETSEKEQELPCFNLNALKGEPKSKPIDSKETTGSKHVDDKDKDLILARSCLVEISTSTPPPPPLPSSSSPAPLPSFPPPPPPPPKTSKVFELHDVAPAELNSRSMFEGIKMLSSQLTREEEVFGESGDEDVND